MRLIILKNVSAIKKNWIFNKNVVLSNMNVEDIQENVISNFAVYERKI